MGLPLEKEKEFGVSGEKDFEKSGIGAVEDALEQSAKTAEGVIEQKLAMPTPADVKLLEKPEVKEGSAATEAGIEGKSVEELGLMLSDGIEQGADSEEIEKKLAPVIKQIAIKLVEKDIKDDDIARYLQSIAENISHGNSSTIGWFTSEVIEMVNRAKENQSI